MLESGKLTKEEVQENFKAEACKIALWLGKEVRRAAAVVSVTHISLMGFGALALSLRGSADALKAGSCTHMRTAIARRWFC